MAGPVALTAFHGSDLKLWLLGTLISAVAYGIVITLCLGCAFNFLHYSSLARRRAHPNGRKISGIFGHFFFPYVAMMFLVSTLAAVAGWMTIVDMLSPTSASPNQVVARFVRFGDVVSLVIAAWGADALVIWRCVVLYEDASRLSRLLMHTLMCLLALASLGVGLAYLATALAISNRLMLIFASITAVFNAILTTLIVLRLWYRQRHIRKALGEGYGSPYTRLMAMCIESAALIVIFNVAHVCLQSNHPNHTPVLSHQLLVHVHATSALLILFRVLCGRARNLDLVDVANNNTNQSRFSAFLQFGSQSSDTPTRSNIDLTP